jgi:hypothetical protein
MRRSAAKVLDEGLTKAHLIFGRYLAPGTRDAEGTVNALLTVLDDEKFIQAWAELQDEATRPGVKEPVTLLSRPHH